MNIKFNSLLSILMFVVSITASAQDEMFKVLASKGSNKVTAGTVTSNVTIGKKLLKTDKITVAAGGYLGLAHTSGKTIEIKNAGTYEVAKLASEVASQNKGVCKKYVDFVVGEMTAQDEDMAKNKYKYMAVTGSVERAIDVKVVARENELSLQKNVKISWVKPDANTQYIVKLTNLFDEVTLVDTINSSFIILDLNKSHFKEQKAVVFSIRNLKSISSDPYRVIINSLPDDKELEIKKELESLQAELKEETALNKLVLANFYAQHKLDLDAINTYQEAIKLAPGVELYETAYNEFLVKKGLMVKLAD